MTETGNDHDLVQLLQKGNDAAFDSLFEVYSPKLYGFALKYSFVLRKAGRQLSEEMLG